MKQINIKVESKIIDSQELEGIQYVREAPDKPEICQNMEVAELDLSKILQSILEQMTDEEFDEAWNKVKLRTIYEKD